MAKFAHDRTHIWNPWNTIGSILLWAVYIKRGDIRCIHGIGLDMIVERAESPCSKVRH